MKKYEMLNQLQNEMKEARTTVEQLCSEWNWTLSDKEATIVTNEIIINKGKVTAIEITKEDNSTIEMLRETIRQMNQNMNDMQKQHEEEIAKLKEQYEQQMLDMTSEFEYECECIAAKRDRQIDDLKGELLEKDLLLDEFREAMDEKVSKIHALEDTIDNMDHMQKGMIAGYEGQIQNKQLRIEELEKQIADAKEDKVRAEIIRRKDGSTIEVVDDPLYNKPQDKPVVKQTKAKEVFDLAYEELESHDGVKVKVRDLKNNIVFYAVMNMKYDKPAYSISGKTYTRHPNAVKQLYKYDEQLKEHLMNRLSKKFNLQQTVEENIHDEQEIVVNVTNDKQVEIHVDEDPMAGADELDL